ncbi:unnamed protein product [Heterobilharzia americana]|nr:unnamed protein product [Heterobilharzia americana]
MFLLGCIHLVCPRLATPAVSGSGEVSMVTHGFEQQDASECWTELIRALKITTVDPQVIASGSKVPQTFLGNLRWNPIDRFLTGQLSCRLSCTESEEPETESMETFTELSCFMNQDVKHLFTGIRNGLTENLTKYSSVLNRDAVYKRVSLISRLPAYLCIHFVRFFYKEDKKINAKVLKDVKFPLALDMHEFCTPDLQQKLLPMREKIHLLEKEEATTASNQRNPLKIKPDTKQPDPFHNPSLYEPYWFLDDPGSNNSGYYELQGVLSHQGRTSTSGHYVAWVKIQGMWFKLDDDVVSQVTSDDILRLSGGGDWHCAYFLLYGPRCVKKESMDSCDQPSANTETTTTTNGSSKSLADH